MSQDAAWAGIFMVIGSLLAVMGGIWQNRWQRSRVAKDEFRIFALSKISDIPEREFGIYFLTVKPQIRLAVEKLNLFLNCRNARKINAAWQAFCDIDYNKLQDQNEKTDWAKELYKIGNAKLPESPSVILRTSLEALIKAAS